MLALTFLLTNIKKAIYKKRATHYEQLIFQNRLMALFIYAIFMIIAPFLNATYPFKLLFCSLVCQTINLTILLSQKNTYISAISCQITFFIPLYFTAAKLENSLRIPCVSLAVSVLYYLQFYPLITNISFMCFIFFLVSKPKAQLLELFYFDERFSTILTNGIGGWPLATCFIFLGISAYQILNEKVWKDYISAKREIQKKNQELQFANQKMAEMVSKLEQTNQRLEVSNKELGEALKSQDLFVACVSHELRNPLNAMMGNIELLQQENLSESHKKMLKTCQVCGDILLVLINNILDVAKINADKLEINSSSINIQSIIEKIWDVSKVRIVQKGLKGRLVLSDNLPLWLKADAHRIMQIILNLINNATKFTNSGGITVLISWKDEQSLQREDIFKTTVGESESGNFEEEDSVDSDEFHGGKNSIDVSRGSGKLALITDIKSQQAIILTEKDSDMKILKEKLEVHTNRQGILQVEVIDTGCGISSEAQSKIFQPFVQGDSSVTRKYGGTGLGLYIIKQLIGKMNGTIQLSSEPNQGARFTLRLPLSTITSEEAKQVTGLGSLVKKDSVNKIANKRQALVVDDNHYNQTVLKSYLNKMDIHVDFADNGLESVQKIQNNPPGYYSFITMDIQMPVMDGITASKKIRQYEKSLKGTVGPIPIIIITGNCSLNEQKECMDPQGEIKAAYFFNKPFLFTDCKIAVEFLLSEKEKSPTLGRKKILVVDDDSFNRDLLRVQIQRLGLSCEICPSGIEALEKLRNNREFGVVLMDFEMPGMNGIEATKRIRAEIKGEEELYIIGTTGNVEEETKRNSLESGMDKVLTKPISLVQITMLFKDLKLLK